MITSTPRRATALPITSKRSGATPSMPQLSSRPVRPVYDRMEESHFLDTETRLHHSFEDLGEVQGS